MRPSIQEARELFGIRPIRFIEVGVAEGTHAKLLVKQLNFKELVLTDVWENISSNAEYNGNFVEYEQQVKEYFKHNRKIKIIKGYSVEVAKKFPDNYFDMVYLDAGHEYKDITSDITAWYPKVKKGGILAGHDYENSCPNYPGLDCAIKELSLRYKVFALDRKNKDYTNSDWWIIKDE